MRSQIPNNNQNSIIIIIMIGHQECICVHTLVFIEYSMENNKVMELESFGNQNHQFKHNFPFLGKV